jgi:hypothetical protein
MAKRDKVRIEHVKQNRTRMVWLVAGAAVVVIGLGLVLFNRSSGDSPVATEPTPTSPGESTPTTALDTTPTTEVTSTSEAVVADEWNQIPFGMGGAPGEYRTNGFGVDFRFTVPAGWGRLEQEDEFLLPLGPTSGCEAQPCDALLFATTELGVDEQVALFESLEGISIDGPSDSSVGGASGMVLAVTPDSDAGLVSLHKFAARPEAPGIQGFPGGAYRVYAIDVNGQTVLIFTQTRSDQPMFLEEAQKVVDSIIWRDRS